MGIAGFQVILAAGLIASLPQTVQAPPAPTDQPEKKICKAIVKTGSMLAQRFCLTKAEWAEFNEIKGRAVDTFVHGRGTGMCDIKCEKQPGL